MMDGQGRVLAGAVAGSHDFINEKLLPFQRNTGPNLSPFNAWVVLKGLETLDLRIRRQSENSMLVGKFMEGRVKTMLHPGLASHPQHNLAMSQMSACGPIFSFIVDDRKQAMALLNALQLIDISNNIGDSRSLMTHPATTTHHSVGPDARAAMGVEDGMLRLNVGLEDPQDLIEDIDQALRAVGL
jgi:cystathionine beta-lyase/cystathionine gamma-synthase